MAKVKKVKILVSLPESLHRKLLSLRGEGYTTSGYITHLLRMDFRSRSEVGWNPQTGWQHAAEWEAKRHAENAAAFKARKRPRKKTS